LIEQLTKIIDKVDLDESGLRKQFDEEVARNRRFMRGVMGIKEKRSDQRDVDIRNFAKYVLKEGTMQEQRALLETLQSKILLANKKVTIVK
jgi:hypothetical protein